jgi:hypothetical protein
MRGIDLVAAQCVAGLMAFACFGEADDDDEPAPSGSGGRTNHEGGTGDEGGAAPEGTGGDKGGAGGQGTWDACCVDSQTTTCFCPADRICNFGWFTDFYPDGTCCTEGDDFCSNGGASRARPSAAPVRRSRRSTSSVSALCRTFRASPPSRFATSS